MVVSEKRKPIEIEKGKTESGNEPRFRIMTPIEDVLLSKDNPRIINEKSESFLDLLKSIEGSGVLIPVHVRVHPKKKGKLELLAGERRFRAAKMAGMDTIPAINHGSIGDEAAFDITFMENYQRKDLTPLEEGKAVAILMARHKGDVKAVASALGRSERWVRQRAEIDRNLSKGWVKRANDPDQNLTAGHLGLIARLPKKTQDELMTTVRVYRISVKSLEDDIAGFLGLLAGCPWDQSDQTLLPKAGACLECKKRSGFQPGLFHDDLDPVVVKKAEQCLDRECYREKEAAFLDRQKSELKKKHPNLVFIMSEYCCYSEKEKLEKKYGSGNFIESEDFKAAKKSAPDALPALVVYGKGVGKLRWVKKNKRIALGSSTSSGKPKTLKERRAGLDAKRWAQVLIDVKGVVEDSGPLDSIKNADPMLTCIFLAVKFGTLDSISYVDDDTVKEWVTLKMVLEDAREDREKAIQTFLTFLWGEVRDVLSDRLTYRGSITEVPDYMIKEAGAVGELLGIDVEALFKDVSGRKGFTEPKSWASLKADGTPKKK